MKKVEVERGKQQGKQSHQPPARNGETFVRCGSNNALSTWIRIIANQLCSRPYRVLVTEDEVTNYRTFFNRFVAGLRLGIFILGSDIQGSLILMPTPFDSVLLGFIASATFFPRIIWSRNWRESADGVDRVVLVRRGE